MAPGVVAIPGAGSAVIKVSGEGTEMPARSLNTLLDEVVPDFLTMDVEGPSKSCSHAPLKGQRRRRA